MERKRQAEIENKKREILEKVDTSKLVERLEASVDGLKQSIENLDEDLQAGQEEYIRSLVSGDIQDSVNDLLTHCEAIGTKGYMAADILAARFSIAQDMVGARGEEFRK